MEKVKRVFQQVEGNVIKKGQYYTEKRYDNLTMYIWVISTHVLNKGETIWEEVFDD